MARERKDGKIVEQRELEHRQPTFTRSEWDEIMRWRLARMIEAGERIPTLDELLSVIRNVVQKTRSAR